MNICFKPCVHYYGHDNSVSVSEEHFQYSAPRPSSRLPFFRRLYIRILSFFQKLFK